MLVGEKLCQGPYVPYYLLEEEIHANLQRRDLAIDFIQTCLKTLGHEPSDVEVLEHLNIWGRPTISEYDWVDENVMDTSLTLSTEATLGDENIMINDPS